jgi:CO/xanthine dehydrogenase Mo-binding subunit
VDAGHGESVFVSVGISLQVTRLEKALENKSIMAICLAPCRGSSANQVLISNLDETHQHLHRQGDVETTFRNAAYTCREQFRVQRMTAMTMETRGLLAEWDARWMYLRRWPPALLRQSI